MQCNASGLMVASAITAFLLTTFGTAQACTAGIGRDHEVGTRYLLRDHRGELVAVAGSGPSVLERRQYGAWGGGRGHVGIDGVGAEFSGQGGDCLTGLIDFGVRNYDAASGRWLSPDPAGQFASPYLYAFDAPHEYVDAHGAEAFPLADSPEDVVDLNGIQPALFVSGGAKNDLALGLRWSQVTGRPLIHAVDANRGMYNVYTPRIRPKLPKATARLMLRLNESNVNHFFTVTSLEKWATRDNMVVHLSLLGRGSRSYTEGRAARFRVERLLGERPLTRRLWMVHDLMSEGAFESIEGLGRGPFHNEGAARGGFAVIATYDRTHGVNLDDGLHVKASAGRAVYLNFERGNWLMGNHTEERLSNALAGGTIAHADSWGIELPVWRARIAKPHGVPNPVRWFRTQFTQRQVRRGDVWMNVLFLSGIHGFKT